MLFSGTLQRFISIDFVGTRNIFRQIQYILPSGFGLATIGGCDECTYYSSTISVSVGGGEGGSSGGSGGLSSTGLLGPGDSCPPESSELVPNTMLFNLFLIQEDTAIYACEGGVIVGRCVITTDGVTEEPTSVSRYY